MTLLPPDFDFHGSQLVGYFDVYRFESEIGRGAQGVVLKFLGINTGAEIVFKHYAPHTASKSTRFSTEPDAHYYSYLNEKGHLEYLSVISRVNAFTDNLKCSNMIGPLIRSFYKDILRVPNGYPKYKILQKRASVLLETASEYNHVEKLCNFSSWPLVIDYARYITKPGDPDFFIPVPERNPSNLGEWMIGNDFLNEFSVPVYNFIRGQSLSQVIQNRGTLNKRTDIIEGLVCAVSNLHYFGIAHRDIKPENVIIRDDGSVVLVDFGISQKFAPSDRVFVAEQIREKYLHHNKEKGTRLNEDNSWNFECPAEGWQGARLFANIYNEKNPMKTSPIYQDDVFSVVILIIILLTGQHPLMPDVTMSMLLHNKNLKRAYQAKWLNKFNSKELSEVLYNFKSQHNNDLIKDLLGYLEKKMTNNTGRISHLARILEIKLPASFPEIFDYGEIIMNNGEYLTLDFSDYAHNFAITRSDLSIINIIKGTAQFEKSYLRHEPKEIIFPAAID